jgi:hypothetical protein
MPERLPVVLSRNEGRGVLDRLHGTGGWSWRTARIR